MQRLLIQALALRQLGRLSTRKLLNPGQGPYWTEWCPRTLHTRQLCGSTSSLTLGTHKLLTRWNTAKSRLVLHQVRFKSSKKKGGATAVQEEEEDDEKEKDLEDSDYEDEPEDDPSVPKDYKDIEKYVQSFRYDVIMKAGLDIARNKVEDAFYGNKLWLNGQKLIKKSKSVKVGDTLDLVLSENKETDTVTLLRVIIKKELGESKDGDRSKVVLRRWKNLELPKQDAFKQ
ncbi:unnamed protein product [Coregonus sp. 'balchen']|uniref:Mitochondrial transcription rescue factor 1 C-terminal domain-containing protein n=1 Tax=Coregonus suidteri TaxID=861788 RepID=A0AAN8L9V7_9TELE|nr:mitochondrial transcription rescue factor 1-like [Coregonus clupeaformis]CAB1331053.1 unnamed protein product [Coregonus sp. 'balchen']